MDDFIGIEKQGNVPVAVFETVDLNSSTGRRVFVLQEPALVERIKNLKANGHDTHLEEAVLVELRARIAQETES